MRKIWFGTVLALAVFAAGGRAGAAVYRPVSLDETIEKSDAIFLATCEGRRSEFRNGNIMSIYTLRPTEFLKGKDRLKVSGDGTFETEQIGGSLERGSLRIGQHFTASFSFVPGEEVLLFAKAHQPSKELDALGSPRVYTPGSVEIFARNGRYSVLTDPATGQKYVTTANFEKAGVMANEASLRAFLQGQSRKLAQHLSGADQAAAVTEALAVSEATNPVPGKERQHSAGQPGMNRVQVKMKGGEIRDFDKLSDVRDLVTARIRAIELKAQAANGGTK